MTATIPTKILDLVRAHRDEIAAHGWGDRSRELAVAARDAAAEELGTTIEDEATIALVLAAVDRVTEETARASARAATTGRPISGPAATDKQRAYLARLLDERPDVELDGTLGETILDLLGGKLVTKAEASNLISALLDVPPARTTSIPRERTGVAAAPGYYAKDDVVYVVVENKAGTSTYAKRLRIADGRGTWDYVPGAARDLGPADALSIEEAARLGKLHGICVVCGRTLTDPESVERGIGPVCATRVG